MTITELHERAEVLRHGRVPFVHARVVLAERPTSAKPGDEALVLPDGSIEGFVGGQCAESTVRLQSLSVLSSGSSMLLRIAPNPEGEQAGKVVVHNPCLSGGTIEIFLEPVLPDPLVAVLGDSPIAQAMGIVGASLGYDVRAIDEVDLAAADAVVAASHGKREEEILVAAVRAGVPYIGLIASPKRGAAVLASLDLTDDEKARIHTPAGLNIGARTAGEIALSVLAQLIHERSLHPGQQPEVGPVAGAVAGSANATFTGKPDVHSASADPAPSVGQVLPAAGGPADAQRTSANAVSGASAGPTAAHSGSSPVGVELGRIGTAIDPVCGMTVFMEESAHRAEVDGTTVWFCCPGCRREYLKDPRKYAEA